jgi:hypothetical protein
MDRRTGRTLSMGPVRGEVACEEVISRMLVKAERWKI